MPEDENLCTRCSLQTGGCCHTQAASAPYCFPLSEAEIDRLMPHAALAPPLPDEAGQAREAVCTEQLNTPDFIKTMEALFPFEKARVQALFPAGGSHYRLRLLPARLEGAAGDSPGDDLVACAFLGPLGCCLPRQARPWYCLLYPGWVSGGSITIFQADACLASRGATSPAQGLARIGLTQKAVRELFARLKDDWGFN